MVALNSNCSTVGCGPGSAQYTWLKGPSGGPPGVQKKYAGLLYHPISGSRRAPSFTTNTDTAPLWNLLYAARADVILNGHDHLYERFKPPHPGGGVATVSRGIREFIVGTGGAQHYAVVKVHNGSAVRNADTFGVLQITLGAGTYSVAIRQRSWSDFHGYRVPAPGSLTAPAGAGRLRRVRSIDRLRLHDLMERERQTFRDRHPRSRELADQAKSSLLYGVPMNWMTRWPGDHPVFVKEASGAGFLDVDGNRFVDFCLGDTGGMAGHSPKVAVEAIAEQAAKGITLMLPTEDAAWVGTEMARRFGLPYWSFTLTATDANRFVIRWARALTGRSKIVVHNW